MRRASHIGAFFASTWELGLRPRYLIRAEYRTVPVWHGKL